MRLFGVPLLHYRFPIKKKNYNLNNAEYNEDNTLSEKSVGEIGKAILSPFILTIFGIIAIVSIVMKITQYFLTWLSWLIGAVIIFLIIMFAVHTMEEILSEDEINNSKETSSENYAIVESFNYLDIFFGGDSNGETRYTCESLNDSANIISVISFIFTFLKIGGLGYVYFNTLRELQVTNWGSIVFAYVLASVVSGLSILIAHMMSPALGRMFLSSISAAFYIWAIYNCIFAFKKLDKISIEDIHPLEPIILLFSFGLSCTFALLQINVARLAYPIYQSGG